MILSQASDSAAEQSLPAILGSFLENTDDLVTVVDREARFVYVNPTSRRVFGLEPEACLGRSAWEFCHAQDRARTQRAFADWMASEQSDSFTFWNRQVAVDGSTRHMHWRVQVHRAAHGEPRYLASIARDISALKEAERERLRSETRLRSLFAGMLDAVITIDPRGIVQEVSDSVRDVFGYQAHELVGKNIKLLMPEPHRTNHDQYLARYRETGDTWILNSTRQFQVLRKDQTPIEVELSVSRIDVPGQAEPLFCGSFRDVSARLRAERALAESERRFRAIFDQEFQYVGLLSPDGTLLEVNRTSFEATGLVRDDAIGKPFWETPWWSGCAQARERLRDAVRRAAAGEFVRFETEIHVVGDGQRTIDFSLKPLRDDEGRVTLLIPEGRDITELKRAQQREHAMLRSLAALGESASLLAHEIKNPITAVNLALRAVADQLGEDHSSVLEDLVGRMKMLEQRIRRALSFTRPVGAAPEPTSAASLFAKAVHLLQPESEAKGIAVSVDVPADDGPLFADPGLTEEVLTNLLRNAIDELPAGGHVRLMARPEGRMTALLVEDDGPGVPANIRDELFRPFFTTKRDGTGLGLAIAKKIIEEQGGTLELWRPGSSQADESELGREALGSLGALGGACFRICLPSGGVKQPARTVRRGA